VSPVRRQRRTDSSDQQVEQTLETMKARYGYCEHCAKDAILFLRRQRYA
jgi:serine protein kinase